MEDKTIIVRNHAVFCASSKLIIHNIEIESMHLCNDNVDDSAIKCILHDIFEEPIEYDCLLNYYSEALYGIENVCFSYAHIYDTKHAIRIDKDNNILLYYYQDTIPLGIPWDYPHLITCIGSLDDNGEISAVLNDLKELSTLDFLLKYYIHENTNALIIKPICEGYRVNDFLSVIIDTHISFEWTDSNHCRQKKYIADTWGETNDDIISDLTSMNLIDFGKEYDGFWGK